MDTTKFDAFNRIALYTLVELFEAFPSRMIIDTEKLGLNAKPVDGDETNKEIWESMDQARDTLIWLNDEGFVSAQVFQNNSTKYDVRLTLQGLTLLGYQAPHGGRRKFKNIAHYAKSILAAASLSAATELMKEIFLSAGKKISFTFFGCPL